MQQATQPISYFNSRPRKEVDNHSLFLMPLQMHFNSRPRKEVDRKGDICCRCNWQFQLTTSQGGRLFDFYNDDIHHYFNSRPRKEVDEKPERTTPKPEKFQLTTSQGGRPMHPFSHQTHLPFQLTTSQGGRRR